MAHHYQHLAIIAHAHPELAPMVRDRAWVSPDIHPLAEELQGQLVFLNEQPETMVEMVVFNILADGQYQGTGLMAANRLTTQTASSFLTFLRWCKGLRISGLMLMGRPEPLQEGRGGYLNPRIFERQLLGGQLTAIDGSKMKIDKLEMCTRIHELDNAYMEEPTIKSCNIVASPRHGRFEAITALPRMQPEGLEHPDSFVRDISIARFLRLTAAEVQFIEVPGFDSFIGYMIANRNGRVFDVCADRITWFFSSVRWPGIKIRSQCTSSGVERLDGENVNLEVYDFFYTNVHSNEDFIATILALPSHLHAQHGFVVRGFRLSFVLDYADQQFVARIKPSKAILYGDQRDNL